MCLCILQCVNVYVHVYMSVYMCALVSEQVYVCMLVHKTSLASGALSISY